MEVTESYALPPEEETAAPVSASGVDVNVSSLAVNGTAINGSSTESNCTESNSTESNCVDATASATAEPPSISSANEAMIKARIQELLQLFYQTFGASAQSSGGFNLTGAMGARRRLSTSNASDPCAVAAANGSTIVEISVSVEVDCNGDDPPDVCYGDPDDGGALSTEAKEEAMEPILESASSSLESADNETSNATEGLTVCAGISVADIAIQIHPAPRAPPFLPPHSPNPLPPPPLPPPSTVPVALPPASPPPGLPDAATSLTSSSAETAIATSIGIAAGCLTLLALGAWLWLRRLRRLNLLKAKRGPMAQSTSKVATPPPVATTFDEHKSSALSPNLTRMHDAGSDGAAAKSALDTSEATRERFRSMVLADRSLNVRLSRLSERFPSMSTAQLEAALLFTDGHAGKAASVLQMQPPSPTKPSPLEPSPLVPSPLEPSPLEPAPLEPAPRGLIPRQPVSSRLPAPVPLPAPTPPPELIGTNDVNTNSPRRQQWQRAQVDPAPPSPSDAQPSSPQQAQRSPLPRATTFKEYNSKRAANQAPPVAHYL